MSEQERLESEKLVEIHQARDEWEGDMLISYLRDNGIEATLQARIQGTEAGRSAGFGNPDTSCDVSVLEHEADRARELVKGFAATLPDAAELERVAMQHPPLDKQHIGELRQAVREERKTFDFLRLAVVVFLGALALLWAIWPLFLPEPLPRFTVVALLVVIALFLGRRRR